MSIKRNIVFAIFASIILQAPSYSDVLKLEAVVNADALNIRKDADAKSDILTSVKKGSKLNVISANENNTWYKVEANGRTGWVDKNYIKTNVVGSSNYTVASTLGTPSLSGVLSNAVKSGSNNNLHYVLNYSERFNLKTYDKNNNFINSMEFSYPWVSNEKDFEQIALVIDDENNIYTNNNSKNIITKYDQKGLKLLDIGAENLTDISYVYFNLADSTLYVLESASKNIKGFDKLGQNTKNIFLSESRVPKSFYINKSDIYVLDYPENESEYYTVYYVDSYSFVLKNNYDLKSKTVESLSKGSILKNDPNRKQYKTKAFIDNDQTKTKDVNWIDFSDTTKKFGVSDELKKVDVLGEIDIYKTGGNYQSTISLNDRWSLKSPDRHRNNENNNLIRKIKGVITDANSNIILPVITTAKNSNFSSLNYYYLNTSDNSYKISQPIPFDNRNLNYFYDNDLYTSIAKGHLISLDTNGIEKDKLGILSPYKINIAQQVDFNDNNLFIFDKMTYSIGKYDLNGDPVKVIYREQKSDLFNYEDVFFSKSRTLGLKSLVVEDKKLGVDIFDEQLNKISDKWLITMALDSPKPKAAINEDNEVFIYAKGNYYNKKVFLSMFNDKGHMINSWPREGEIANIYNEDERKSIRENTIKVLGFDQKANVYILLKKGADYKIHKVKINTEGRGQVLKILDANFLGDLILNEDKTTKRVLSSNITGEVLKIEEGKQGFTYIMVRDNFSKQVRMAILEPSGNFWKDVLFSSYPDITSFSLDNNDNIWISRGPMVQKFANYK